MSILSVDRISYQYRTKQETVNAVRNFSFSFEQGVFYAVMGPSGSGKTTLLSLLAGLDLPIEGVVSFEGTATSKMNRDRYRREHVSVIYQNFNLFGHLTVLENAAYPLLMRGLSRKKAEEVAREKLLEVGLLEEQFRRLPNMLSGGEQQRLAIARALTSGSELVLADEPTGNLDSENSRHIVEILQKLAREENRCVIVVTHDPEVADSVDIVLRMRDGQLVE